jgi:hypothetical protein
MQGWLLDIGALAVTWVALRTAFGTALGGRPVREWRTVRTVARLMGRARRTRPPAPVPLHRPIEQVGPDVRRLREAFHRRGMRFAKYEGCRQAYDAVLAEAAEILEIDHLLRLLPPGDERDRERDRVEDLLDQAGLSPRRRAA